MYVLKDDGKLLFFRKNPRFEGFLGNLQEDIELYIPDDVFDWPEGAESPRVCVGVSRKNTKWYRTFSFEHECRKAGYDKVWEGAPKVYESWPEYLLKKNQRHLMPEHAKECIAINLETAEYVLGKTPNEVYDAFEKRWGNKPMFARHVDGSPLIKFHHPLRKKIKE